MLVSATESEGDMWLTYDVSPFELIECYKTGILNTRYAGSIKVAAVKQASGCMVYDFVLKDLGLCPTRFIPSYQSHKCMWAQ